MSETRTYLSVKIVAELYHYCERRINQMIDEGKIEGRPLFGQGKGRGGKVNEVLLESLPEDIQKAYLEQIGGEHLPVSDTACTYSAHPDTDAGLKTEYPDNYSTKSQKERGALKKRIVAEFKLFKKFALQDGVTSETKIKQDFLQDWNVKNPDNTISQSTLYSLLKRAEEEGVQQFVDKRGGHNRGDCSAPLEYLRYFKVLVLQSSKPNISQCYRETLAYARYNGEEDILPSESVFRRFAKSISCSEIALKRGGKIQYQNDVESHCLRDYSTILPNDYYVSDHHLMDVFVRYQDKNGKWRAARPWGSYVMDVRTRKILAWYIRLESPNADIVLYVFGLAIEKYGVPKHVYLDNGKDYRAKDLFYTPSKNDEEEILGNLAKNLGIEPKFTLPYHGQSKNIERFFRTLEESFGKMWRTYAGSDAKNRPEDLKHLDIMEYPTLEEFKKGHDEYIEFYNNSSHTGDSMEGKSPNYWYYKLLAEHPENPQRMVPKKSLLFYLLRVKGIRKIQQDGIKFNNTFYDCIVNEKYIGREVFVRYSPMEPDVLYIFDTEDNFMFTASKKKKYGYGAEPEEFKEMQQFKKESTELALRNALTDDDIKSVSNTLTRIRLLRESVEQIVEPANNARQIIMNPKIEENARKAALSLSERKAEEVEQRARSRKKAQEENAKQKEFFDNFNNKFSQDFFNKKTAEGE